MNNTMCEWSAADKSAAIENIMQVKASYCRHIDTKAWARFTSLFTQNACMQMGPDMTGAIIGCEAIAEMLEREIGRAQTVHHVHPGEFHFNDDGSVTVVWPMFDIVDNVMYKLEGAGFYRETYVFSDSFGWRIMHWRLLRTRIDLSAKSLSMKLVILLQKLGLLRHIAPDISLKMSQSQTAGFDVEELPA